MFQAKRRLTAVTTTLPFLIEETIVVAQHFCSRVGIAAPAAEELVIDSGFRRIV